ncbi:hypothetical protein HHI36_011983, partial [Cryptolaemus montrouzieri]
MSSGFHPELCASTLQDVIENSWLVHKQILQSDGRKWENNKRDFIRTLKAYFSGQELKLRIVFREELADLGFLIQGDP